MTARPFALLASRAEDRAADDEYASVLAMTGLRPDQLVRVRTEAGPFTPFSVGHHAGVILGGSPFTTTTPRALKSDVQHRVEDELAEVLAEVLAGDVPFLGLCYGVGMMARVAGGAVDGSYAEQTSAVRVSLTDAGRADPLLAGTPAEFDAYVGHKEACTVLPPGAVVLATSSACPVQMYRLGEHQYVTQFHPEMDRAALVTRIEVYRHSGYFAADEADAVVERISRADVAASHRVLRAFVERYADRVGEEQLSPVTAASWPGLRPAARPA